MVYHSIHKVGWQNCFIQAIGSGRYDSSNISKGRGCKGYPKGRNIESTGTLTQCCLDF